MNSVIWTQAAIDDLMSIRDFIARDSVFYAAKFVDDVFLATGRLESFPKSGTVVPERNRTNFREIIFGTYRIIYHLKRDTIYIVAVVHGKQNYTPS